MYNSLLYLTKCYTTIVLIFLNQANGLIPNKYDQAAQETQEKFIIEH